MNGHVEVDGYTIYFDRSSSVGKCFALVKLLYEGGSCFARVLQC